MRARALLCTLSLFAVVAACAQATFIRTFDDPADLNLSGSRATSDDGLILTGRAGDEGFLLRLDRYGNVRWLKTCSSLGVNMAGTYTAEPYDEQAFEDVMVLPHGDLFAVGWAYLDVQGPTGTSMLMARFDSLGSPIWSRTINTSRNETFGSTALFDAHTALVGGQENTLMGSSAYLYSVDLDSAEVTRSFVYDDVGYAGVSHVARSPDGAVLMAFASDAGHGLRKLTDTLSTIWQGCWTMNSWNPYVTEGTPSGRAIALGSTGVVRHGPTGIQEWALSITSTPAGVLSDLVVRPNGNLVLLGHTGLPDQHSYLVELDSTGALQWSARYGAPGDTMIMNTLHLLSDGSLRMVGTSGTSGRPTVIAVDAQGQLAACPFPPPVLTFGALTPVATAPGTTTTWGSTFLGRHEELPSSAYPVSAVACAGASASYQATGLLYIDLDQDGQPDLNEPLAPWQAVQVYPNSGGVYTTGNGTYLFAPQDSGTYVLSAPLTSPLWQLSSDSASYTVHLGSLTPVADPLDFGWAPLLDSTVINAAVIPGPTPCIGSAMATVNLLNQGTTRPDLVVSLTLDTLFTFSAPSPAPDSIVGHTLHWHVDSLALFSAWQATLSIQPPGILFVGDTAHSLLQVLETDSLGVLQVVTAQPWESIITCAYDPNDKQVEPVGEGAWGGIDASTEWLTYTVRFQNTGNDTAQTVVVEDDLSGALQWSTMQVIGASHALTGVTINPSGKAAFRFDNILLPDSNVNEPASHGFVRFRVKPMPGLAHLTTIENNAGIFFDLNPPVITNTVRNTFIDCAGIDFAMQMSMVSGDLYVMTDPWGTMTYTYQWYLNQVPIPGATFFYLEQPQQFGDYQVVLTDIHGCTDSATYTYIATFVPSHTATGTTIFPNPMVDHASIRLDGSLRPETVITVLDAQGRIVRTLHGNGTNMILLDRGDLAPGLYVVRITDHGAVRFVVE